MGQDGGSANIYEPRLPVFGRGREKFALGPGTGDRPGPAESWSHEEYLVACLQREVAARESRGGEGQIRAARFRPARA
jgi:DNA replication protein DnaC